MDGALTDLPLDDPDLTENFRVSSKHAAIVVGPGDTYSLRHHSTAVGSFLTPLGGQEHYIAAWNVRGESYTPEDVQLADGDTLRFGGSRH